MPYTLFVYGTLKRKVPGGRHALLRGARYVGRAHMAGNLHHLGKYPGAIPEPGSDHRILGEL